MMIIALTLPINWEFTPAIITWIVGIRKGTATGTAHGSECISNLTLVLVFGFGRLPSLTQTAGG